jgi:hypothetical protein
VTLLIKDLSHFIRVNFIVILAIKLYPDTSSNTHDINLEIRQSYLTFRGDYSGETLL